MSKKSLLAPLLTGSANPEVNFTSEGVPQEDYISDGLGGTVLGYGHGDIGITFAAGTRFCRNVVYQNSVLHPILCVP